MTIAESRNMLFSFRGSIVEREGNTPPQNFCLGKGKHDKIFVQNFGPKISLRSITETPLTSFLLTKLFSL